MFILNRIKFDADNRYDIYEKRISKYYYNEDDIKRFQTQNLTEYIYKVLVQSHLTGVFYDTSISVCDVKKYIQNLYITYYNFYIKKHINDGKNYIITKKKINEFTNQNSKLLIDTEWIYSKTSVNIPLDEFITNVFKPVYSLPTFIRFSDKTVIDDVFIYLAKLLDFIIESEMNTLVFKIAKGDLQDM